MRIIRSSALIATRSLGAIVCALIASGFSLLIAESSPPHRVPITPQVPPIDRATLDSADPSHPVKVRVQLPSGRTNRAARVTLKFNDGLLVPRGAALWGYTVNFTVTPDNGTPVTSALTINRGIDKEAFEAVAVVAPLPSDGATLTVTGSSSPDKNSLPDHITLEFRVTGERDLAFDPTKTPSLTFHSSTNTVELQSVPQGAGSYEFEWTYVDDQDPSTGYARDPVRARSPSSTFKLDLAYPSGKVNVRGRALGRFSEEASNSVPARAGRWSTPISIAISNSCGLLNSCVAPIESNINWTYLSSFAEGSEPVSNLNLFDGSLRNRQAQQRMRTQGERLVSETEYDTEGRGRVKMLPAPATGETYGYVPNFSAFDTGGAPGLAAYDQQAFDGVSAAPSFRRKHCW